MSKNGKISLIFSALVVVALLAISIVSDVSFDERGRSGPEIAALGHSWKTTVFDGEDDHNTYAIWTILEAPDTFDPASVEINSALLIEMCNAVLDRGQEFLPDGVALKDLDHVDINFRVGQQKAFPHDATIMLEAGRCVNRFVFDITASRQDTKFSQHGAQIEGSAIMQSWGLEQSGLTFSVSNTGRTIKVEYEALSNFQREISTGDAAALCVLTLMAMDKEVNLFVTKIDPSTYTELEISIARNSGIGAVNYSRNYGSATIPIKDGKCVGVDE